MKAILNPDRLAAEVQALPPMVPSLLRLTEMVGFGEYSLTDVERLILFDQGLTLDTLKLANSAMMVAQKRIGSVREAVLRLGAERLSHYLFSRWLGGAVHVPLRSYGIDAGRFWSHGVIAGIVCEKISEQNGTEDSGLAFTAGLLHDFGKIVLDHFSMRMRIEVDWSSLLNTEELQEAERLVFGTDHMQVGASLMESWNFPEALVKASQEIRSGGWESSMLGYAHRVDCCILSQEQGEENACCDTVDRPLTEFVRQEYQNVKLALGM